MKKEYKVLNLYCGIGGNRKLWTDCQVTAVEINPEIAAIYKDFYPEDTVIIGDAHQYLLEHFKEFDFIWASPPCPSHSRINTDGNQKPKFPDMKLYQEIIMLSNNWFKGKFVIENVIPYYKPLINPTVEIDRHLFWANFKINPIKVKREKPIKEQNANNDRYGFSLKGIKINHRKDQILRNLVNPEIGKYIFDRARNIQIEQNIPQGKLF